MITTDDTLPDAEWRHYAKAGADPEIHLTDLVPSTQYIVRVNVHRKHSDEVVNGRTTYRFRSLSQSAADTMQPASLTYRPIGANSASIRWTLPTPPPATAGDEVTGYIVMYSTEHALDYEQWMKILVTDRERNTLLLTGLKPATKYFVKILRRHADGTSDDPQTNVDANVFEIVTARKSDKADKTDSEEQRAAEWRAASNQHNAAARQRSDSADSGVSIQSSCPRLLQGSVCTRALRMVTARSDTRAPSRPKSAIAISVAPRDSVCRRRSCGRPRHDADPSHCIIDPNHINANDIFIHR